MDLRGRWVGYGGGVRDDGTVSHFESNGAWLYNHIDMLKLTELVTLKSELYDR